MTKADFEIRAPLLIAGGDPKSAELCKEGIRAPSLRDALKFRAMVGEGIATGRAGGKSYGY